MSGVRRVLLGFALAMAAGAVAGATIPDSARVIHACLNTSSSGASPNVRIIDSEASQSCTGGEQSVKWSQQGRSGPAGAQGPAGATGQSPRVLHFGHDKAFRLPRKRGTLVAQFELPQGNWFVFVSGQVQFPSGKSSTWIRVSQFTCSMKVGDGLSNTFMVGQHIPRRRGVRVQDSYQIISAGRDAAVPAGGAMAVIRCGYTNDGKLSGRRLAPRPIMRTLSIEASEASPTGTINEFRFEDKKG